MFLKEDSSGQFPKFKKMGKTQKYTPFLHPQFNIKSTAKSVKWNSAQIDIYEIYFKKEIYKWD